MISRYQEDQSEARQKKTEAVNRDQPERQRGQNLTTRSVERVNRESEQLALAFGLGVHQRPSDSTVKKMTSEKQEWKW